MVSLVCVDIEKPNKGQEVKTNKLIRELKHTAREWEGERAKLGEGWAQVIM